METEIDTSDDKSPNVLWHHGTVNRVKRERLNKHRSVLLWFTGLSGSGKSTLAHAVEERLHQMGCQTFVMDGDNVRHGLCSDLGFSERDRTENIRRIGEVAKLFLKAGLITLTAFISPYRADRERARAFFKNDDILEIYCRCSLEICEARDVKGLYKRARAGEIANFTGISSPYEEPSTPELTVDTDRLTLAESVNLILALLSQRGVIQTYENDDAAAGSDEVKEFGQ